MKRQRKRLVPDRPHKPGGLRWHALPGWHRPMRNCRGYRCLTGFQGIGGRRADPLAFPF